MNRQKVILASLLALFFISSVIGYLRMPRQGSVDKLKYVAGMTVKDLKHNPSVKRDANSVHLDLLEIQPHAPIKVKRNLFRNLFAAPSETAKIPLPPPPPPPQPLTPVVAVVEPPAAPAVVEPSPIQRDMARFTFLGFLKKDNQKTIFLSNDKEIFLVKKGDKIAGKYDVTSLTDESLTISSIHGGGEITIPLVENRPLSVQKR